MKKIIKSFKKFESFEKFEPSKSDIKTFGPNDFKSYREEVDFWEIEHKRRHFGSIVKEELWKGYVKPGFEMSLVEVGESGLASVLHKGNEIIKALDENDNKVTLKLDFLKSIIKESRKYKGIYENMTSPSMSFTFDEYSEYLEAVRSWEKENGVHKGAIKSKGMWDSYVKPGIEITLVDIGKKMVSVLHRGSDIISAFDQNNEPIDQSLVSDRMVKFFE
jgi:hypothetical protein